MITCGWCGTKYTQFQPNCQNCGGLLPPPPGMQVGPPPPPAPRALPGGFERRMLWTGNVFAMVGGIFLLVGVPLVIGAFFLHPLAALIPMIHCTLGYLLLKHGRKKGLATVNAFKHGKAVEGEIAEVYQDTSTSVNGRHPWAIVYRFSAGGNQMHEGKAVTFDSDAQDRARGQKLWVLYVEDNPAQNTIYPPVK
jgi:hypothetical protein